MPPIRHLDRLRGTDIDARFVLEGAVATDDLDLGMVLKPYTEGGLHAVRQQFNSLMSL